MWMRPPDLQDIGAEIIILAGDIAVGTNAILWADEQSKNLNTPIIILNGNHEYYRSDYKKLLPEIKKLASDMELVYFLENDCLTFEGENETVDFLGCTLWTNFEGLGSGRVEPAKELAKLGMTDYNLIRYGSHRLTPDDTIKFHAKSIDWLQTQLSKPKKHKRVVITHHGVSPRCHSFFKHGQPNEMSINFWSDLEDSFNSNNTDLIIYGHTHSNLRFEINEVRVICNQRGYPNEKVSGYDPNYIIEI
jgi:predicted phosphodiesterase